jgi:nicotinamide-nucleotide amidase
VGHSGVAVAVGLSGVGFSRSRSPRDEAAQLRQTIARGFLSGRLTSFVYTLNVNAEIIAAGSEMLTPFRQDTNSLYLTEKLNDLGVEVTFKTIVGDNREHLKSTALLALSRSDVVVFIGGLGPTEDDLTREAVADALGLPLRRDPEVLALLEQRFAAYKFKMSANNLKQADVIAGATVLPNPDGTAPGQWVTGKYEGRTRIIILLPGPPHELKALFEQQCLPRLKAKLPEAFIATRLLKVAGLGESNCDARIAPIYTTYPDVQTTILAGAGEIQLHLRTSGTSMESAQDRVDELAEKIEEELEECVFSDNGDSLEQIVGYYLQMQNATLAVAESCTGGLLAERITSVSGSSRYFLGGAVVYSNELKTQFAGVPAKLIEKHGAVSREVAVALAEGIRKRCGAKLGVGITGVAGPTGGTEEKPVGLVFHAVATERGTEVVERRFPGDRQRIRWFASQVALDMVRKKLIA